MKVGVIGAGTMGQGIAKAFAMVDGYEVALCDIKKEWAENGKAKIEKGYARLVEKGKMTQDKVDAILAKITPGLKEDLCADCDLIVEAAFENMEVKKTTFAELDKIAKPECIFASNTSSLSITEIGNGLTRPMIGMHFFNPADRMKLVEVIAGVNTPVETVDAIKKIAEEIGKTNPDAVVLIDEAYVDFGGETCLPLVKTYDNLLVTRTFSKSRCLAGGRLGYAFASPEIIADLEKIKYSTNPYNINRLTLLLGEKTVEDGRRRYCRH